MTDDKRAHSQRSGQQAPLAPAMRIDGERLTLIDPASDWSIILRAPEAIEAVKAAGQLLKANARARRIMTETKLNVGPDRAGRDLAPVDEAMNHLLLLAVRGREAASGPSWRVVALAAAAGAVVGLGLAYALGLAS